MYSFNVQHTERKTTQVNIQETHVLTSRQVLASIEFKSYKPNVSTRGSTRYLQYFMTAIFTGAVHVAIFGLSILSSDVAVYGNRFFCINKTT